MNLSPRDPATLTRRHFFGRCGMGLGSVALASLLDDRLRAEDAGAGAGIRPGHHRAKAKSVIFLFMAGGPSQLELFDWKPRLAALHGQPIPDSFLAGKRFAFMDSSFKNRTMLLGSKRTFARHGQSGTWISDLLPHTAGIADEIAVVRSCRTNLFNHAPAKLFMNTGSGQFGRPSMGSWLTYGLGSESRDLPGFVVLQSGPRGPRGGAVNWGSGFLPTSYQGVTLRGKGDPILDLSSPPGIDATRQRRVLDAIRDLNLKRSVETGDPEILTRIASYEMAYRMQSSAPELMELGRESDATLRLYGCDREQPGFARNCILARRLVERGTRFVQLYHTNWDSHGGTGETLETDFPARCREVDQACAALVKDLRSRGLLDSTLVVWGGEFGRTPMGEPREKTGRNHHIDAFSMWFAGGGVRGGQTIGETDELGFNVVADTAHVHDLHATMLHLLGLDHLRLTFRFQGRDYRLTDVEGEVLGKLIA
ncbi:MAG: DUF1501 domain-containing protein [Verrucomicrobia bacterium]|nr:MAG: DUF1501 domain-containing protein [Verrucomicrobiota bacterium]